MEKHELPREKCFVLFGDNCNVNKLIADLTKMALLGCRSHGFNLDVEAYNEKTLKSDIETVYLLIVKLKTLKNSGAFSEKTFLCPKLRTKTRWTGCVAMFKRFLKIKDDTKDLTEEITDLIPRASTVRSIVHHLRDLQNLKAITKGLQNGKFNVTPIQAAPRIKYRM